MLEFVVFQSENGTEGVVSRELEKLTSNGVNIIHNYLGEIKVRQCPPHIKLQPLIRYYKPGAWTANRFVKWPLLLFLLNWILIKILWQSPTKRFVGFSADVVAWFAQIFKFLGRIEQTVIVQEDWSLPIPQLDGYGRFNIWKVRVNDWLLMHFDTTVVVTQKELYDLRNNYWKGKTKWNTRLYDGYMHRLFEPKRQLPEPRERKGICYFATMRPHNGIEFLFELLPSLNAEFGMTLKVVSPPTVWYEHYQKLAVEMGVNHLIQWEGFLQNDQLSGAFEDCFCGMNIQQLEGNSQQFVVAGRLISFLQYYLVPLVTRYSGVMVDLIKEHHLGVLCDPPDKEALRTAIVAAYRNNREFLANIDNYWTRVRKSPDIRIYLDPNLVPEHR